MTVRRAVTASLLLVITACGSADDPNAADPNDDPSAIASSTGSGTPAGADSGDDGNAAGDGGATPSAASAETVGPGTLVDGSAGLGIDEILVGIRGHAAASADVDGDGWDDLFVGTFADRPIESYQERGADGPAPDRLLYGSPEGFVLDPDFDGRMGRTAGALFDDLDDDGDPDLIVSRNVRDRDRGRAPSEVYRNDDGRLVPWEVLDDTRGGRAIATTDFDHDGRRDIVLVEDRWSGAATGLFRNEGDLRFTEVTAEVGFPVDVYGLGVAVGDLDGDGIDDLVVGGSNRWFLGDGEGFVEGPSSPLPWRLHGDEDDPAHVALLDVDADGRLDIVIGQHFNSTVDEGIPEPVRLFLNRPGESGEPSFADVTEDAGLPPLSTKSPQIVVLDLDANGRDDVITTASYALAGDDRSPVVLLDAGDGDGNPRFEGPAVTAGPHYWIDAVTLDANGDGRTDVFFVEWEPALGSKLFLNLPADTAN